MAPPKVLLFDIGGVCVRKLPTPLPHKTPDPPTALTPHDPQVVSPLQAILDYELAHNIPPGYINFAISRGAHDGAWQRLERGAIPLDDAFFVAFKRQLEDVQVWREYWGVWQAKQKMQAKQKQPRNDEESNALLKELGHGAMTAVPPRGDEREKGEAGAKEDVPPVALIDTKPLFWTMMRMSRSPDPWMWPALKRLRRSGKFVLAALSNTVIFPEGVRDERNAVFESGLRFEEEGRVRGLSDGEKGSKSSEDGDVGRGEGDARDIRAMFDVFISSAHVGLRKPDPKIFELAVKEVEKWAKGKGKLDSVQMRDVLFIDDIGSNLKTARKLGMQTLKVNLGRNRDAVKELEKITSLQLLDEGAGTGPKARL